MQFEISLKDRALALAAAVRLDLERGQPHGTPPYVWDREPDRVNRWYAYGSVENRVGTIRFVTEVSAQTDQTTGRPAGRPTVRVVCETEIIELNARSPHGPQEMKVVDEAAHRELIAFFVEELLGRVGRPALP